MGDRYPRLRVAAVQAASAFLDRDASVARACELIADAGRDGAQLIAFPEGFIPAHPVWFNFHSAASPIVHELNLALASNAVEVPGPETERLGEAAAAAGAYVVMGVCERLPGTLGTLYNTQVFLGPDGEYLGKHQKLVPTVGERIVHTGGHGDTLGAVPTSFGAASGLICGENWNPLALFALAAEQTRVHAMSWPAHFAPHGQPMRTRVQIVSQSFAHMANAFVVSACGAVDDAALDRMQVSAEDRAALARDGRAGGSLIVGPDCEIVAGPLDPGEAILTAEVDLELCARGKIHRDLVGHYNRADVFELHVNREVPRLVVPSGQRTAPAPPEASPS